MPMISRLYRQRWDNQGLAYRSASSLLVLREGCIGICDINVALIIAKRTPYSLL